MIVYVDSSAFAKRYLAEAGSRDVEALVRQAEAVGTALITRPEISAAIATLVRLGSLDRQHGEAALRAFRRQWPELTAIQLTEAITAEADTLAWQQDLRGTDAVHLASALSWQRALERAVILATYDKDLWRGAQRVGRVAWPERLRKPQPATGWRFVEDSGHSAKHSISIPMRQGWRVSQNKDKWEDVSKWKNTMS